MSRRAIAFYIFLGSAALFLAGLQNLEFVKINCRFALFVREMGLAPLGPFPLLYGEPYCDYPSVHTYLMYLASLPGGITMLSLTLPSALAAAGVMTLTYLIGARISGRFGLFAALMLAASYEFLSIARAPSPDMFVAFSAGCAFYLMYTAELENKALRLLLLPLLFTLGFIMRGPIGAIIPIGTVCAYYLAARRWKTAVAGGILGALVLTCGLMLAVIIIYRYGGRELVKAFRDTQINSRMSSGKPFWFYFTNAMGAYALTYPLSFFVMGVYWWKERQHYFAKTSASSHAALRQRLTAWMLVIVLGMSVPGTKHLRYIVAAIPAAALLSAFLLDNPDKLGIFRKVRNILLKICHIVPFAALAAVLGGAAALKVLKLDIPVPLFLPGIMFMVLGLAMITGPRKAKDPDKVMFVVALTVMTFFVIKIMVIEPLETYAESSQAFVRRIEKLRPAGDRLGFCGIDRDGEALKYLVNLQRSEYHLPVFVKLNDHEQLLRLPPGTLIVFKAGKEKCVRPEVRKRLKEVGRGKLGHRKCILYQLVSP
ncbi:MAG: glycosyltransferase family 39 protein [Victivallaceae bacterium]|nr:glycosyltransferase family 39 protein [Victivallaceae bacterium]